MDIAVSLALAVAERTLDSWRGQQMTRKGGEVSYPLDGCRELWQVRLRSADTGNVVVSDRLSGRGASLFRTEALRAESGAVKVNLAPSGTHRLRRALGNMCSSFEIPLNRSRAVVATGALACVLTVLAGGQAVASNDVSGVSLPDVSTLRGQCRVERSDMLLADCEQPAKHRVFTRSGRSGVDSSSETRNNYKDKDGSTVKDQTWANHCNSTDTSRPSEFQHVNVTVGDHLF